MTETIVTLVAALRDELEQYGEMLALLDRQQQHVINRAAEEVFHSIGLIKQQGVAIQDARARRELCRERLALAAGRPAEEPFPGLIPLLPPDYRPLVTALVHENNELLVRVRQRARQNHLLLSRSVELMQGLINSLFPGRETKVYNRQGSLKSRPAVHRANYEAVG
jgi:flagellar biosynthesis/type III secretory pathway chaperone